jgi:hypothetical protein
VFSVHTPDLKDMARNRLSRFKVSQLPVAGRYRPR